MKRKILGTAFVVLGAVLILIALGAVIINLWQEEMSGLNADHAMEQLWEQMTVDPVPATPDTPDTPALLPENGSPSAAPEFRPMPEIQVDGILSPSSVEELVTGNRKTPFPLLQYTERADKFARGLLSGRVGLLVDGLPLGWLLPVDLGYLMTSPEDEEKDYVSASAVRILRYASLLTSLLLPGIYIALVTFHQQMIPLPLLKAMVTSRADVPFSSLTEVAVLLLAFELLQEAGLHLPQAVGHSVSIIGGIVVGSAAVEANLISPAALIAVSFAGICGFALPNRDLADSVRVCRFALTVLGGAAGLFGVTVGTIVLMIHLSGLTSLGHPYLAPFSQGDASGLLRRRINEMDRRGES